MAWVLDETPLPAVWKLVNETPCLSKRVAIYDLSGAFGGELNYLMLNQTENSVLREFEGFLNREYGIKLKPFFETLASVQTKRIIEL